MQKLDSIRTWEQALERELLEFLEWRGAAEAPEAWQPRLLDQHSRNTRTAPNLRAARLQDPAKLPN